MGKNAFAWLESNMSISADDINRSESIACLRIRCRISASSVVKEDGGCCDPGLSNIRAAELLLLNEANENECCSDSLGFEAGVGFVA